MSFFTNPDDEPLPPWALTPQADRFFEAGNAGTLVHRPWVPPPPEPRPLPPPVVAAEQVAAFGALLMKLGRELQRVARAAGPRQP